MNVHKLIGTNFTKVLPETGGIYWIFSFDKNKDPRKIKRVLKDDTDGILYIGCASNLRNELLAFSHEIQAKNAQKHTASEKYVALNYANYFPFHSLHVMFIAMKDYESELVWYRRNYIERHGELPPLNQKI